MSFWEKIRKLLDSPPQKPQEPCHHCQELQTQVDIWNELCERYSDDLMVVNLKKACNYMKTQRLPKK